MRAMVLKSLAYLVALSLLLINHGAKGHRLARDKLDYEKQFKLLQKTSVKTIKNKYGDIYDCVDFYEQPAFDHPLLANHTFHHEVQMKPSCFPFKEESTISQEIETHTNIKSRDEDCPIGTIPIKRLRKDDFIKMKQFTEDYTTRTKSNDFENHFAVVQTYSYPSTKIYKGAKGDFSYFNFEVSDSQFSSGEITIKNGEDTIKVGWTINPKINKDNRTRIFQYFNAGQSHCFNLLCPGFVIVNKDDPIDEVLEPMSKIGGHIYGQRFKVFKDPKDGNWWLVIGPKNVVQGFWPGKIFNGLADSATFVSFGGEAYGPVDQPLPLMGSGYLGVADPSYSAIVDTIAVLDENLKEDNNPKETETYNDDSHYVVTDFGWTNAHGRLMFYGGTKQIHVM